MKHAIACGVLLCVAFALSSCGATRPLPPAPPSTYALPWGAVDVDAEQQDANDRFERSLADKLHPRHLQHLDRDGDGKPEIAVLAISGGGSRGAFSAGFLRGWSETGTRPKFQIVTGISTGALMATHAFLGAGYDDALERFYTNVRTADVYRKRSWLELLFANSLNDTAPLRRLLEKQVDDALLDAVAAESRAGRGLYVASVNLDHSDLVVWDLGAIADSGRPDRLARYREALLASSSIPVFFPPVYFEVEHEGKAYGQMHVDGVAASPAFFRGFMFEYARAAERAGVPAKQLEGELYVLMNDQLSHAAHSHHIRGSLESIAMGFMQSSLLSNKDLSLYFLQTMASRHNFGFNYVAIPETYPAHNARVFDPEAMQQLYRLGHDLGRSGPPWSKELPQFLPSETPTGLTDVDRRSVAND